MAEISPLNLHLSIYTRYLNSLIFEIIVPLTTKSTLISSLAKIPKLYYIIYLFSQHFLSDLHPLFRHLWSKALDTSPTYFSVIISHRKFRPTVPQGLHALHVRNLVLWNILYHLFVLCSLVLQGFLLALLIRILLDGHGSPVVFQINRKLSCIPSCFFVSFGNFPHLGDWLDWTDKFYHPFWALYKKCIN